MHTTAQNVMRGFGQVPRPAPDPAADWLPWEVHARDTVGFRVSRENTSGTRYDHLKNSVNKAIVFRSRERAEEACAKANKVAA